MRDEAEHIVARTSQNVARNLSNAWHETELNVARNGTQWTRNRRNAGRNGTYCGPKHHKTWHGT